MTTAQARRAREMDAQLRLVTQQRDALLDSMNAVLSASGGRIVVPDTIVLAATRKTVHVRQKPGYYVFELEDAKPEKARTDGLLGRLGLVRGG